MIRVNEAFDASGATRLAGWLAEVPAAAMLVLDFTGARDCQDSALAAVANDLAARQRLVVHGLSRHQERMLRYFGVVLHAGAEDLDRGEKFAG